MTDERILYAIFEDNYDPTVRAMVETLRHSAEDWQYVPPYYCVVGHGHPTPRAIWIPDALREEARSISGEYLPPGTGIVSEVSLDEMIDNDDDRLFDLYERQRSLSMEQFDEMTQSFGFLKRGLTRSMTPGCLLGRLESVSTATSPGNRMYALRPDPALPLLVSLRLSDALSSLGLVDIGLRRGPEWCQMFAMTESVGWDKSLAHAPKFCEVCGFPTQFPPEGTLRVDSEGLPEFFFFEHSGMPFVHGRTALVLLEARGIVLKPWGTLVER